MYITVQRSWRIIYTRRKEGIESLQEEFASDVGTILVI